jgi:hypothetical protein
VIHHGGAGTTAAGLRAGNPTFICPFFGDQHFWAAMVARAGAGPPGCPITHLTTEKLTNAIKTLLSSEVKEKATLLSVKMNAEDGVTAGVDFFHKNLPLDFMLCEVSIFRPTKHSSHMSINNCMSLARVYCETCDLKMCHEVDEVIHRGPNARKDHVVIPYHLKDWEEKSSSIFSQLLPTSRPKPPLTHRVDDSSLAEVSERPHYINKILSSLRV